jgi:cobalt-precorrin-5B (C1)-methyltransferase
MWPESAEQQQPLRSGLTTGACATACCVAAAIHSFTQSKPETVSITLPKGKIVEMAIQYGVGRGNKITAATIKDAGDDPDVTHGATVFVELHCIAQPGVFFHAAEGVGTVTRPGLLLAVGEPAINPVPRKMMCEHLEQIARRYHYSGGFSVAVGVRNGELIARSTMNARLGIMGGLSILGTTGIVRPFSCSAWIASIHQSIDVARANGVEHIAATTGNSSEAAIQAHYGLSQLALIEMGDFAGAVFKHLKKAPVAKLSICGGIGKISKLANGHLDLNSRSSSIDFDHIALVAKSVGAGESLMREIHNANTSVEALSKCDAENIPLGNALCERAYAKAKQIVPASVQVEVWAIDRQGRFVGVAS